MSTCLNAALSWQGHVKGQTWTCYVRSHLKQHIRPNGRVLCFPAALFDVNVPVNYLSVCSLCLLLMFSEGINQKSGAHMDRTGGFITGSIVYHADLQALLYTHICTLQSNNCLFSRGWNKHTHTHTALVTWWLKKRIVFAIGSYFSTLDHSEDTTFLWCNDYGLCELLSSVFINKICCSDYLWVTLRGWDKCCRQLCCLYNTSKLTQMPKHEKKDQYSVGNTTGAAWGENL